MPWIHDALVDEVTICSPRFKPVEPLASVVYVKPIERSPAAVGVPAVAASGKTEADLRAEDAAARGLLYRPAIGQILGVG